MNRTKNQVKELLTIWGAPQDFIQDIDNEMTDGIFLINIFQNKNLHESYEWYAWDIKEDGPLPGITLYQDDELTININLQKFS